MSQICPFCRETIHREAVVCRYCRRDLQEPPRSTSCSLGWLAALTVAAAVTAGLVALARGYLEERRHWLE